VLCTSPSSYLGESRVLSSIFCFLLCGQLYKLIVLLNSLFYDEVLCWKTSSVNALVDSGACLHRAPALRVDFMGCLNLAEAGMRQLRLPTKSAAEKEIAGTFTKKCLLLFSQI